MSSKKAAALLIMPLIGLAFVFSSAGQTAGDVVINELMYHPVSDIDGEEYVELTNTGVMTLNLSGWRFCDGFDYIFPPSTLLPPGGYLVVAHDPDAVASRYGLARDQLMGPFQAKRLSNAGERIALCDAGGSLVDEVTYDDDSPWPAEPDGGGAALELINPTFENGQVCSWAASSGQGTPGIENSVYAPDIPPCIENVLHSPALPTSNQIVTVTASIKDNGNVVSAIVYNKKDEDLLFGSAPMVDDGSGADAIAGDGVYSAQLPPYTGGSLVEFYVEATDDAGLATRMPNGAPATTSPETGRPVTVDYLVLFQDAPPTSTRPIYHLLVTDENWTELTTRDLYSNELLDATFVHDGEVYYNVGLRYRGESSRPLDPKSYRINFPSSHLFHPAGQGVGNGVKRLNLIGDHISREALTYDLFQRAGLAASEAEFVDLYVNADYQALYLRVEQVDEDFLANHLPGDDGGNLYRAKDGGDLGYRGPNPDDYRPYYLKKTNEADDDYSDVITLTDTLDNGPENDFQSASEAVADMQQWVRWFALNAVVFNTEGALFVGQGDDYFLYHRPSDERFLLIPWDHDSTFYQAQGDVWAPNLRVVKRILRHPPFTRLYYQNIAALMADEFSVETMHPLIDTLPSELDAEKGQLKQFVSERISYLSDYFANNLPDRSLAITTNGGQSFSTTQRTATLEGECSVWRDVYVNGSDEGVTYPSIYNWHYTTPPLRPRANRFVVTDRDSGGSVVTTRTITVTYDTFDGGTLAGDLTLTLDASPHIILDDVFVPPSLTLTIEPGVTVAFAEGVSLFVEGRLVAEGSAGQPITFTRDQDSGYWGVIGIYGSRADNRLTHVRVEYAGQADYQTHTFSGVGVYDGALTLQDSEVHNTSHTALELVTSSVYLHRNQVHDALDGAGLRAQRSLVVVEDNLFRHLGQHGIQLSGEAGSAGSAFQRNVVYDVQGDCVHLDGLALAVERNELHHCTGAGVSLYHTASLTLTNNLIRHNAVGVLARDEAKMHLAHNTLVYNGQAGLALYDATQTAMINSILWDSGAAISPTANVSITVSHSDVQDEGTAGLGEGNINADPQFRHPAAADFRLRESSPCIDYATSQGAAATDLVGIPRPRGEGYDMGAYEFFEYYAVYLPLVQVNPD